MRIIQTYQTFDGENLNQGFKTKRAFMEWMRDAYFHHTMLTDDYTIYTDNEGYEVIKKIIDGDKINIVEFPRMVRDRIPTIGKFYTHHLQKKTYIHVDLDMKLYKLPEIADVISEGNCDRVNCREGQRIGLKYNGYHKRIWCGLIGFNDIDFKDLYVEEIFKKITEIEQMKPFEITRNHYVSLEEDLLSALVKEHDKNVFFCNENDLLHLRDNLK